MATYCGQNYGAGKPERILQGIKVSALMMLTYAAATWMILIRAAEVKAATQAVPKALLALCNMILPIAVIENCNPIGTPIANKVRASPA